ncbi:TRAP dicarboxylate transporter subunit DctP [Nitratireductor indicus C115]|uniref:TRAP dicarboxylate transporter subunit DctP n=1 Tax=Nitratireductor indicus C115 TaxID=1231190 RepID=K2PL40_9HYPH|nr:DctP family TRAP transporter solute-binding subunit [Nitratireductor indicus]EKF41857.1 TRAP dicarboxylate transporter subunit DctP [Nitratireductor indicus C115]SFQ66596.1 tripartite ATP-independent transporter solute receptor, DctP family [Nitratireductor indicus]
MKLGTSTIIRSVSAAVLAGFLGLSTQSPASAETTIRLGHVLADTHSWHEAATGFAKDVAEKTEGRVKIEVFPSGQLGTEKEVIEGMQIGTIQAGLIGSGSFQFVEPKFGIIEMPYAWTSREQAFAALDGDLGTALSDLLRPKGIEVLGWWENGFRNITNNVRPIEKPADLEGLKIRVTPDKVRLATFELLGAQPAPLSFGELYSALQQGVFDAQENPLSIIDSASFFEVQKYVSMTGHIWGAACLTVSSVTWAQISPEDQAVVKEAAVKWGNAQRQMIADSETALMEKLKSKGMQFNDVDKAAFIEALQPIWESQKDVFGPELLAVMDRYRK